MKKPNSLPQDPHEPQTVGGCYQARESCALSRWSSAKWAMGVLITVGIFVCGFAGASLRADISQGERINGLERSLSQLAEAMNQFVSKAVIDGRQDAEIQALKDGIKRLEPKLDRIQNMLAERRYGNE